MPVIRHEFKGEYLVAGCNNLPCEQKRAEQEKKKDSGFTDASEIHSGDKEHIEVAGMAKHNDQCRQAPQSV
ncbi:hypothetical protein PFUM301597_37400 [Pseudomonas fluorescens]